MRPCPLESEIPGHLFEAICIRRKIDPSENMAQEVDRRFNKLINEFDVLRLANVTLFHPLEESCLVRLIAYDLRVLDRFERNQTALPYLTLTVRSIGPKRALCGHSMGFESKPDKVIEIPI